MNVERGSLGNFFRENKSNTLPGKIIPEKRNEKYNSSENFFKKKELLIPSYNFPDINKQRLNILYNPNYFNYNSLPQGGVAVDVKTGINADNIAEFAYPLAQFVEQVKPDYIIACDRGARIIALAVHVMYGQLYGELPTKDHRIRFRKISHKVSPSAVREALRPDVERMLAATAAPTVLVLDDWIASGGTKDLVKDLFADLSGGKINLLYGVMRGDGADVSGKQDSTAFADWNDNPNLVGVDYNYSLEPHKVFPQNSAIVYRQRMIAGIKRFVKSLQLQPVS